MIAFYENSRNISGPEHRLFILGNVTSKLMALPHIFTQILIMSLVLG